MSNPYNSPSPFSTKNIILGSKPPVVTWYRVYVFFMLLLYLVVVALGLFLAIYAKEIADDKHESTEILIQGIIMAVVGVPFVGMYFFGLFSMRSKFGWIFGIVLIAIGLTSCCTLPATIPLLIHWLKDENKAWHNCLK